MRSHRTALAGVAAFLWATTTVAQQGSAFRQIFASDSLVARFAQTSPDGKWVVIAGMEGFRGGSLWMASVAGGAPIRLTSSGFNDGQPVWFPSGDRIAFMSTRPNRNGAQASYLMTLAIDQATGRAVGAPRQVTSEPVTRGAPPSPDGRWIPYVSAGATPELKLVPANGGIARSLTSVRRPVGGVVISPDGLDLYYTEQAGPSGAACTEAACTYTIRSVAVTGGTPEVIASADHPLGVLPADPRYLVHQVSGNGGGGSIHELRDRAGTVIGRLTLPAGVSLRAHSADGYGLIGVDNRSEFATRVVAVAGGSIRTVGSGERAFLEAWMADGAAVVTDRRGENGGLVVEVMALNGTSRARHTIAAPVERSGWRSSVGPWFSFERGAAGGLHALNLLTGDTKLISASHVFVGGVSGRGGMDQDGPRQVYGVREGSGIAFRSTDPTTGATTSIREFRDGVTGKAQFLINGTRMAWFRQRGDSVDLMLTEGPSGAPRRIYSAQRTLTSLDEAAAWSWSGDRIALCERSTSNAPILSIFTVPTASSAPVSRREIALGSASSCWAPQWLPDDSGLVLLIIMDKREDVPDLAHLSLRDGSRPIVLTRDDPNEIWSFYVSPDGRSIAYPSELPVSKSSIHVASFKSMLDARR